MWKGTPVIGGNVGGIRCQIKDGVNGFLVSTVKEAARTIVQLVKDKALRERMRKRTKETVRKNFLLSRYLEQYLDLFSSFETICRVRPKPYLKPASHAFSSFLFRRVRCGQVLHPFSLFSYTVFPRTLWPNLSLPTRKQPPGRGRFHQKGW